MKISIVTASYNQGKFIKHCIDGVMVQPDVDIEHIILDNCSEDGTAEIIALYEKNHGSVDVNIIIEPDKGQTAAINKGFKLATGDIICWLNTDEWYGDNALSLVVAFFKVNPDVDVVFGDCDFVNSTGKILSKKREFFYSKSMLLFYGCYIPSCSTFVRRRVIDDGLLLDPEFKVTMDFDWYVRIATAGYRFAHLPATLASFTWHETNISSNFVGRRMIERRLVQDRYSGVPGPSWFRTFVYSVMRFFWLFIRVTRRFLVQLR